MVKLDENYKAHIVKRWIQHYLDYDTLKDSIEPEEKKFQPK
jgi:SPX domain protein involved in polyphosphate accumulation